MHCFHSISSAAKSVRAWNAQKVVTQKVAYVGICIIVFVSYVLRLKSLDMSIEPLTSNGRRFGQPDYPLQDSDMNDMSGEEAVKTGLDMFLFL
jgi:hypothetical protein